MAWSTEYTVFILKRTYQWQQLQWTVFNVHTRKGVQRFASDVSEKQPSFLSRFIQKRNLQPDLECALKNTKPAFIFPSINFIIDFGINHQNELYVFSQQEPLVKLCPPSSSSRALLFQKISSVLLARANANSERAIKTSRELSGLPPSSDGSNRKEREREESAIVEWHRCSCNHRDRCCDKVACYGPLPL